MITSVLESIGVLVSDTGVTCGLVSDTEMMGG